MKKCMKKYIRYPLYAVLFIAMCVSAGYAGQFSREIIGHDPKPKVVEVQDPPCSHHYRISYFVDSQASKNIGENVDVFKFLEGAAKECEAQNVCLWELEVVENGNTFIHCIERDH